jgi:hypothetical protein
MTFAGAGMAVGLPIAAFAAETKPARPPVALGNTNKKEITI